MNLKIDLQKGNKAMTKSLTINLEKAKYKKRIPKAGGELILSQAKKAIGDNDMNKAFDELTDFLKSTIEDESQPIIGTGQEQGAAMGLAGKGANKGNPESGSGKPEVGNPPKAKVQKLSEDDEEGEKAMKPHKKPIEKSIPLNTWNQTEYMQREHRMYYDRHNSDDGILMTFGKVDIKKSEESEVLSDDDQAAELVKSGNCMVAGNNSALGFRNQLVQKHICPNCENAFMKALTVCPYCGH